jgi:hypothetical protein
MELTQEYLDKQIKNLVTKEDLDRRLANVATKDDLDKFATKDDLLELATKSDLSAVHSDIGEIKQMVQKISEREDQDTRAILHDVADLKKRVTTLERSSSHR